MDLLILLVLTLWQAVPHVEPVILAVTLYHQQGVVLQIKGQEREHDVHVRRGDDHIGALQIVRVFIWKARWLDHAWGAGEIAEAEFWPCEDTKISGYLERNKRLGILWPRQRLQSIIGGISHLTCRGCSRESFITNSKPEYSAALVVNTQTYTQFMIKCLSGCV